MTKFCFVFSNSVVTEMANTRSEKNPDVTGLQGIQSYSTFVADGSTTTNSGKYKVNGSEERKKFLIIL